MEPALRMSAARRTPASSGVTDGQEIPRLEGTCLNACPGGVYSSSWTSDGRMIAVGAWFAIAIRIARSRTFGSCSGTVTIWT